MQSILVYSDSLTWGIIPDTRKRLTFDKRWPGVCEGELKLFGYNVRVIENCLNGRRTVWEDPFKAGRNGAEGLSQAVEIHSPLSLVVIMLGTNDFQSTHSIDSWMSSQGVGKLISIVRSSPIEPGMQVPNILVIAPPKIMLPKGAIANKFKGAELRSIGYVDALEKLANEMDVYFMDSNNTVQASKIDGIHLDSDQHGKLGKAVASKIVEINILVNALE